jgi:CpeT protein
MSVSSLVSAVLSVASSLSGNFTSSEQALQDPEFFDINLFSCPALVEAEDSQSPLVKYLYVEQAVSSSLQAPYRQRIYRVSGIEGETVDTVKSEIFLLNTPEKYIGMCAKPLSERLVKSSEIKGRDCFVTLTKNAEGNFSGQTPEGGCPSTFRGAVKAESIVTLLPNGLNAWDRGYDAAGNVVWGPTKGPYEFRRVSSGK